MTDLQMTPLLESLLQEWHWSYRTAPPAETPGYQLFCWIEEHMESGDEQKP